MKPTKKQKHVETREDMFTMPQFGGDPTQRMRGDYGKRPAPEKRPIENPIAVGNVMGDRALAVRNRL